MQKHKTANRAWNLIRRAFLWARERRIFRRRIVKEFRLFPKFLESLTFQHSNRQKAIAYREQQFSFDTTPMINFKKLSTSSLRFKIPCIQRSRVDFDDFEYDYLDVNFDDDGARKSFLKDEYKDDNKEDEDNREIFEEIGKYDDNVEYEEEIDAKAEHFIAQFYEQMKLQKQLSYARYKEMLDRGMN